MIDLNALPQKLRSPTAEVYTKPRWFDSWTLRHDLIPVQSVWLAAPGISSAALEYRFGRVLLPGAAEYDTFARITTRGYWVLIRWLADDESIIDWLGYAETAEMVDYTPARDGLPESGRQAIPCHGMLRTLDYAIIDTTVYADPNDEEKALRSGGTGAIFNASQRGNRSKTKRELNGVEAYVFAHPNDTEATWWSTRDIVEHVARFHLPTPNRIASGTGVPWTITNVGMLPNWDRPVVESDLISVSSILTQLMTPSQMLGWGVGTSGNIMSGGTVTIQPYSLLPSSLTLPRGTLPGNANLHNIAALHDPLTTIRIDEDSTGVVDQIMVQGPREISVCTLSAAPEETSTHKRGWETEDEWKYSDGAKFAAGFAGMDTDVKRIANEMFRTTGKMADVYALYLFRQDWNGKMGTANVFEPNGDQEYVPAPMALELLDWLPLYNEVDYTGPVNAIDESEGLTYRKPIYALRKLSDDGTVTEERIYTDKQGKLTPPESLAGTRQFNLQFRLEDNFNVRLVVTDAPQHAIAGKGFVGNLGDVDQETVFGNISHKGWEMTIAFRGDRRPRFVLPAPSAVASFDVVRRRIITLDEDSLAAVWIMPGTTVGWSSNSIDRKTSPGGRLRDPLPILESICKLAAKQYLEPRGKATIRTGRRLSQLSIGTMITAVDTYPSPVNAVVSEIRIDAPISTGNAKPKAATQQIVATPYRANIVGLLKSQGIAASSRSTGRRRRPTRKKVK